MSERFLAKRSNRAYLFYFRLPMGEARNLGKGAERQQGKREGSSHGQIADGRRHRLKSSIFSQERREKLGWSTEQAKLREESRRKGSKHERESASEAECWGTGKRNNLQGAGEGEIWKTKTLAASTVNARKFLGRAKEQSELARKPIDQSELSGKNNPWYNEAQECNCEGGRCVSHRGGN